MTREERRVHWQALLSEQEQSGQSVAAWCRARGLEPVSFYLWRKRLSRQPGVRQSAAPEWIALDLSDQAPAAEPKSAVSPLTLRVGRVGIEVAHGFDSGLLDQVLTLLENRLLENRLLENRLLEARC
jgi:hypothetical protein